jgi:caffeoyl-CoA O-methyltransferase
MKKLTPALVLLLLLAGLVAWGQRRTPREFMERPPLAQNEAEQRVLAVLDEMRRAGRVHLEVPPADGRMLRLLAEALNAQHVVEVGTSTGYSGLWLALALQNTGGRLTTFEIDPGRAAQARAHFQQAGVAGFITLVEGDAHKNITAVKGTVDMVFLDADKEGYVRYLQHLLPLLRPGGIIAAHNTNMIPEYLDVVTQDPALETVFFMEGSGMSLTVKKR